MLLPVQGIKIIMYLPSTCRRGRIRYQQKKLILIKILYTTLVQICYSGRRIHIRTKSTIKQEISSKIAVLPMPRMKNGKWQRGQKMGWWGWTTGKEHLHGVFFLKQ